MKNEYRIKDGFKHQKMIVLPNNIISEITTNPMTKGLYPLYLGYFPNARNHYVSRESGLEHHILIMNIKGYGMIKLPDKEISLNPNEVYIIPKGIPHEYEADQNDPWSIYWAHFNGDIADEVIAMLAPKHDIINIDNSNRSVMIQYFNEMISLLEMGYAPDHLYHVTSLFRCLMTRANHTSFIHEEIVTKDRDYTLEAMHYMQEHTQEQLTLERIAAEISISKNHLMVVFKEKTGTSPVDYFIHMKIQKACELLGTTKLSVKQIALELGYSDPYYFSRLFKKVMGVSPTNYQKQNIV